MDEHASDQSFEQRAEELLRRMTLEEKVGQLNVPCVPGLVFRAAAADGGRGDEAMAGDEVPGLEAMAEVPPEAFARSVALCEPLVAGELEERVGPVGGFFGLGGTDLTTAPPAELQARLAALQRRAREDTRLGIPLLQVGEGCHGLMVPGATIFPEGPALGSTWDPRLVRDVFHAVAREARAIGIHALCTLVVEPIRDPRLGRNCEAFSECPSLTRELAHAIVAGTQGEDPSAPDRAGAVLCHFPGQSEPANGLERGAMNVSERGVRSVWLPAWSAASGPAGAIGVMATYAAIDGAPVHGSARWLTDVLRDELSFEGIVLSEGFGFETLLYEGVAETQAQAGATSLRAGVDVGITYERAFLQPLLEQVEAGSVPEALLDRAVRRVLMAKLRLGLFDEPLDADPARVEVVHAPAHRELALRAAREGIVLLKNDGVLPLSKALRRVAVIGPTADDWRNLLGDYVVPHVTQPVETVIAAVHRTLADGAVVLHARGCDIADGDDADVGAAVAAARTADVALVVVGERSASFFGGDERATVGEFADVVSLDLSGRQHELIRAVHATGTPVVLVLVNGRPLSVRWEAQHIAAIVEAWLPGEAGAQAIVDVIFGDHNPSGRLPVTVPVHVGDLPAYYNHAPAKRYALANGAFVDGDGQPLFPFGHGLSYTAFEYDRLAIVRAEDTGAVADVSVRVRNVGDRAGQEVVQLYVEDRISSATTPVMELRGFRKLALEPSEHATVHFRLTAADLAFVDADHRTVVEPGEFDVLVGASSADIRCRGELTVPEPLMPS